MALDPVVAQRQVQQRVLIGAGLVVLGCVFGGLLAVVFNLIGLRIPAGVAALSGGLVAAVGVVIQVAAFVKMQSLKRSRP
jgi:hypothetical protein